MTQYRQGDVFLVKVASIPKDALPVAGRTILAHGEMTGHAHEIKSKHATLFEHAGERFLQVTKPVVLRHQEHAPISLPVGDYRVVRQREYSPEAIRNVSD